MLQSIDRLNRLVEDLLVFSASQVPESEDVDLGGTVAEAVMLAQYGLGDRVVAVTAAFDGEQRLVVRANRERIMQMLTNIVLNATQATPDGGEVTVRAEQRNGSAVVAVHNTGSYISPQVRRQLFVPFFTTKPSGTGLGLAIARQIVMSIDGRIDVESDPRAGTTFTVELPLAVQQPQAALVGTT
jgi:signal transduction histidine kinase